jgi:hypothetical protein
MDIINLISVDYIKKYHSNYIEQNVDETYISGFITIAQEENIKEIIRYELLQKIKDLLSNNLMDNEENSYYKVLWLNFIKPSLALWTVWHAYPHLWAKVSTRSVETKSSDNSTRLSISELEYLRSNIKNRAEFLDNQIIEQINNNSNRFPEYFNPTRLKTKGHYFSGIYINTRPDYLIDPFYNSIPYIPTSNN